MTTRQVTIACTALILLISLFWFIGNNSSSTPDSVRDTFAPEQVVATYTYSGGIHRYEGTVTLPTPCTTLDLETLIQESYPEHAVLTFTTTPGNQEACIQVLDEREFVFQFVASEKATVSTVFNGTPVELIVTKLGNEETELLPENSLLEADLLETLEETGLGTEDDNALEVQ